MYCGLLKTVGDLFSTGLKRNFCPCVMCVIWFVKKIADKKIPQIP